MADAEEKELSFETKEIANCSGCPLFLRDPGLCTHWGSPEFNRIPWHQMGLPEWCPLKEKPLLLKVVTR